jgi:hypothetical protein
VSKTSECHIWKLTPPAAAPFSAVALGYHSFSPTPSTMSAQGGLQRRRVAAASTSSNGFVDPDEDRPTGPSPTSTTSTSNVYADGAREGRVAHAGTAMEGGSKVAYDPRDLVGAGTDGSDDSKVPKLTLLEDVLLLGIKDRAVSFQFGDSAAPPSYEDLLLSLPNSQRSTHSAA